MHSAASISVHPTSDDFFRWLVDLPLVQYSRLLNKRTLIFPIQASNGYEIDSPRLLAAIMDDIEVDELLVRHTSLDVEIEK